MNKRILRICILIILVIPSMFSCSCKDPKVKSIESTNMKTEFLYGEDFSFSDAEVKITYKNKKSKSIDISDLVLDEENSLYKNSFIEVNFSEYIKNKVGEYNITITYLKQSDINYTYQVVVKASSFTTDDYEVKSFEGVYDGKPHTLIVEQNLGAKVKYGMSKDKCTLDEAPKFINADEYTIYFKMEKIGYEPPIEGYGIIKIIPAELTITPNDVTIYYNQNFANKGCTFEGFVNNESKDNLVGTPTYRTDYKKGYDVGEYSIEINDEVNQKYYSANYNITYKKGKLTVLKAKNELVVNIPSIEYGYILSPQVTNPSGNAIEYAYREIGYESWKQGLPNKIGDYEVKASTRETNNYYSAETTVTVSISKRNLKITPKATTIQYNQEFVGNGVTYEGFVNDENESVLSGELVYTTNYKKGDKVGIYTITLGGYSSENYNIIYQEGVLRVEKAINNLVVDIEDVTYGTILEPKIISNSANTKVYFQYQLKGEEGKWLANYPSKAGTYEIKATSMSNDDYDQTSVIVEVTISKANLTIKANDVTIKFNERFVNNGCTYEGFVFDENENTLGVINGEIIYTTDYERGDKAGTYKIEVSGCTADNYNIVFEEGVLTVTKAENNLDAFFQTVSYGNKLEATNIENYSDSEITYSYKLASEEDGEWIDGLPKNAGDYKIKLETQETESYKASSVIKDATITKRKLVVTPNTVEIVYNTDIESYNGVNYTAIGSENFAENENESVLSGELEYNTVYQKGNDVCNYEITVSGYSSPNYEITYKAGYVKVLKAQNEFEVEISDITYGEKVDSTKINIIKNLSGALLQFSYKNTANESGVWINNPTSVGTYAIRVKYDETNNYYGSGTEDIILDQVLTVNKKDLIVRPNDVEIQYNETFVNKGVSFEGFVNGHTESILRNYETVMPRTTYKRGDNAGTYSITVSGYGSDNYNLIYREGILTVKKSENGLTVMNLGDTTYGTALNPTYEHPDKENTTILTKYKLKDSEEWIIGLPTEAGEYIVQVVANATENYAESIIEREIVIKKKDLYIIVTNIPEIEYGEEFKPTQLTLEYSGFVNNQDESVLEGELQYETDYVQGLDVGRYELRLFGLYSANYNIIFENYYLNVKALKNTLKYEISKMTYSYGEDIEINVTNKNNTNEVKLQYRVNGSENFTDEKPKMIGIYDIRIIQESSKNYEGFSAVISGVQIEPKVLDLVWGNSEFIYDGEEHIPTVRITNLEKDDICNIELNEAQINAGSYTANIIRVDNPNYTLPINGKAKNYIINKAIVPEPTNIGQKVYTGELLVSDIVVSSDELYELTRNEGGINAGSYNVEFTLKDANNYKWPNTESDILILQFVITKTDNNEFISASIESYDYNSTPSEPQYRVKYGRPVITYKLKDAPDSEYSSLVVDEKNGAKTAIAGEYMARFVIEETDSYNGCEITCEFTINKIDPEYNEENLYYIIDKSESGEVTKTYRYVLAYNSKLSTLELPIDDKNGDWSWVNNSEDYVVEGLGDENHYVIENVYFTPKDTINYNTLIVPVKILIVDNRVVKFGEGDITIGNIEKYVDKENPTSLIPELKGSAENAEVWYYSHKLEEETEPFTQEQLKSFTYTADIPEHIQVGEFRICIKVTKSVKDEYGIEHPYEDYYTYGTIKLLDYIETIDYNDDDIALIKGTTIDLSKYNFVVHYASGVDKNTDGSIFKIATYEEYGDKYNNEYDTFNKNKLGVQKLPLMATDRVYNNVLEVLVYDDFVQNFQINTFNSKSAEITKSTTKESQKVHSVIFDSLTNFVGKSDDTYVSVVGSTLYTVSAMIDPYNSTLIEENGISPIDILLTIEENGIKYVDRYTLNIITNLDFNFSIGYSNAVYNSDTDTYVLDNVISKTYDKLIPKYGLLYAVYTVDTEEFIYENSLTSQETTSTIRFEDYPTTIIEINYRYIVYRVKVQITTQQIPVETISLNGKDYTIGQATESIDIKTNINESVFVDLKDLNGHYGYVSTLSKVLSGSDTTFTLSLGAEQVKSGLSVEIRIYKNSEFKDEDLIQVIMVCLICNNYVEEFTIETENYTYDISVQPTMSIMGNNLIKNINIKVVEGYSYELYTNNEQYTVEDFTLTLKGKENNVVVVVKDSEGKIVSYMYATINIDFNVGTLKYSKDMEMSNNTALPLDGVEFLTSEEKTIYIDYEKYDDYNEVEYNYILKVNGVEHQLKEETILNTGVNKIELYVGMEGYKNVKYESYIYVTEQEEEIISNSQYASNYEKYIGYYDGNRVSSNVAVGEIHQNVSSYSVDLSKYQFKDENGNILETNITRVNNLVIIKINHKVSDDKTITLTNVIMLTLKDVLIDNNVDTSIYLIGIERDAKLLEFGSDNICTVEAYKQEKIVVTPLNKSATITVKNGFISGDTIYLEQVTGDLIITVTSTDETQSVTYTIKFNYKVFKLLTVSNEKPDNQIAVSNLVFDDEKYTGEIKAYYDMTAYYVKLILMKPETDYVFYSSTGEAYTSGNKYVKVSLNSVYTSMEVYRSVDMDSYSIYDIKAFLRDKLDNKNDILLPVLTENGYNYYELYFYIDGEVYKLTSYITNSSTDIGEIVFTPKFKYNGIDKSIDLNTSIIDGMMITEFTFGYMSAKDTSFQIASAGKIAGKNKVYYIDTSNGKIYNMNDKNTEIALYEYDYEEKKFLITQSYVDEIESGEELQFIEIDKPVHNLRISNSLLYDYVGRNVSTIKLDITVNSGSYTFKKVSFDDSANMVLTDIDSLQDCNFEITHYDEDYSILLMISDGATEYFVRLSFICITA